MPTTTKKEPTAKQLEARRAFAERARNGTMPKAESKPKAENKPRSDGARPTSRTQLATYAVGALLLVLVLAALARLFAPSQLAPGANGDLVPWRGGGRWRARAGQWIDPDAAASLQLIGARLTCSPMTLDVSRERGGPYPPHVSHQRGVDVDIRMKDIPADCRKQLQAELAAAGWQVWYDGPDAVSPAVGGRHISHLHARYTPARKT